jgi:hypothetical protein
MHAFNKTYNEFVIGLRPFMKIYTLSFNPRCLFEALAT